METRIGERAGGFVAAPRAAPAEPPPILPPIETLAIAVEDATADHYGGVEAIRKLLELLLISLILLLQFWAVFTFDTYLIWILYSAVTTIIFVELLPLLP
ncbi:uncharacterized protein DS421_12g356700 [Arachis hypogaea]|nr:uncharacterized protein DS421_12g356700 [Arachis hypogaea]